jgi:hypothetical protein
MAEDEEMDELTPEQLHAQIESSRVVEVTSTPETVAAEIERESRVNQNAPKATRH